MIRFVSRVGLVLSLLTGAVVLTGCGSAETAGSQNNTTSYKGVLAGVSGESGVIELSIETPSEPGPKPAASGGSQSVTGTVALTGGGSITITGTFDPSTGALDVSGGGYSFTGTASGNSIGGSYTGPNGSGSFTVISGGSVTPFCGSFAGGSAGVWNLAIGTTSASGSAASDNGFQSVLSCTVSGSTLDCTFTGGQATGTISGTSASGTWTGQDGDSGTWTGSSDGC